MKHMDFPGNLFVVSAPSGAGKSSLVRALREADGRIVPSVSHTTRAPRGQETHGREYFFVDDAEFSALVEQDAFVEWAHVHGKRYGTSRQNVESLLQAGQDVLLEIDWQGALQIKRRFAQAVLTFVLPPSWGELRARLQRRGEDAPEVIEMRLENARAELAQAKNFDFVIINAVFPSALKDLQSIVHAQRMRYRCQQYIHADVFRALNMG